MTGQCEATDDIIVLTFCLDALKSELGNIMLDDLNSELS